MKTFLRSTLAGLALALLAAAPAAAQPGTGGRAPLNVTHENQGDTSWCNAYALAAILRYHNGQNGANPSMPVLGPGGIIATARARGEHDGATATAFSATAYVNLANRLGYTARNLTGTFADTDAAMTRLLAELNAGRPVSVGLGGDLPGGSYWAHAYVVTGVRRGPGGAITGVYVTHSGPAGAGTNQFMPIADFRRDWAWMNHYAITVAPPNAPVARGPRAAPAAGAGWAGALGRD